MLCLLISSLQVQPGLHMEPILDSLAQKNEGDSGSSVSEGEGEGGEECASSGKSEKKVDANKVEAGERASLGESLVEAFAECPTLSCKRRR